MNPTIRMLLILAVGIIGGMLLFKFGCSTDDDVKKVIEENKRIRSVVDSLNQANEKALSRIDSLQALDHRSRGKIDSLRSVISTRERRITIIKESLDAYTGTPSDLLRDLNRFVHSPLPPFPDSSLFREIQNRGDPR